MLENIENISTVNFDNIELKYQKKGKKSVYYYNLACSYDIETSSFKAGGLPVAITYAHAINIDGRSFLCRTWADAKRAFNELTVKAGLRRDKRLIVYVHNLAYEFQFMKKQFEFVKVFSNGSERKVLTALTNTGIEFRCSYMLTGSSLKQAAKNLTKRKLAKKLGDLDYSLLRTPETPLKIKELGYIKSDVDIVVEVIKEAMEELDNDITKIPLTNTGYIRKYVREQTIKGDGKEAKKYRKLMRELTLEPNEYIALRQAFAGGFTHANVKHSGKTIKNVTARDFASSYPARMITYQFPMSKGEEYTVKSKKDFFDQLDEYCCLFYIRVEGLTRRANESYLSASKAVVTEGVTTNNGRIESAVAAEFWLTDVDMRLVMQSYDVGDFKIGTMIRYKRGYLPKSFVEAVLKLYADKTELKDLDDMVAEYMRSKGMLNSTYGMCVTDIDRTEFVWDDVHKTSEKQVGDVSESIEKNNRSRNRFLFYPWGVWITAYARYDLFTDIIKLGDDYVYSDTDSVYYINEEKNEHIFEDSNNRIKELLKLACDYHNIDFDLVQPKDKNGKRHVIGIWDLDGRYTRFKTLGAKRYMVEKKRGPIKVKNYIIRQCSDSLKTNITVSGINKSTAVPYMKKVYGDKLFEAFTDQLVIPEGHCGKSTHTYIDEARSGIVTDYMGINYEYEELSAVHLEETSYSLTISNEYQELIDLLRSKGHKEKAIA